MSPFRFRLATVLSVWQRREEAAQANLQRQMAVAAAARRREVEAMAARAAAYREAAAAQRGDDAVTESTWHRNWITQLVMRCEAARDDTRRCEANERTAYAAWQRARRDVRVIERLRERAEQRHRALMRRAESKAMDELAQGRGRQERQSW